MTYFTGDLTILFDKMIKWDIFCLSYTPDEEDRIRITRMSTFGSFFDQNIDEILPFKIFDSILDIIPGLTFDLFSRASFGEFLFRSNDVIMDITPEQASTILKKHTTLLD